MSTSTRPGTRSTIRRTSAIVLLALSAALLMEGLAARLARACGGPDIDYGPDAPVLSEHRGRREIRLNFRRKEHSFAGSNLTFAEVRVFTRDARFQAWLAKSGMGEGMWARLKATSAKHGCADLADGRRIERLEQALATQVVEAYRRDTRRSTPRPDLMLVAEVLDQSEPTCAPPAP